MLKYISASLFALFLAGCAEFKDPMTKAEVDEALAICLDNLYDPVYVLNGRMQVISIYCRDSEQRRWLLSQLEEAEDA